MYINIETERKQYKAQRNIKKSKIHILRDKKIYITKEIKSTNRASY